MKPTKYTTRDTNKIDLGTKVIYKYPTPTKDFDIGVMAVNGRHPVDEDTFIIESECSFVIYVLSGTGKVFAGEEVFAVAGKDVVFVPARSKFAVEGKLEYVTFDSPAFYPEQSKEVRQ